MHVFPYNPAKYPADMTTPYGPPFILPHADLRPQEQVRGAVFRCDIANTRLTEASYDLWAQQQTPQPPPRHTVSRHYLWSSAQMRPASQRVPHAQRDASA